MNDVHELNFENSTWTLISADTSQSSRASGNANHVHSIHSSTGAASHPVGDYPSARCSHGAVVIDENGFSPKMYIFGGYAIEGSTESLNKGYLDDLYEFHFDTKQWKQSVTHGKIPSPRSRFKMISHLHSLYLFAGWNSTKHFSTLHRYDTKTHQWIEVETTFDSDGIGQFSMIENNGIMYVYSGFSPKHGTRANLFAYSLGPRPRQAK